MSDGAAAVPRRSPLPPVDRAVAAERRTVSRRATAVVGALVGDLTRLVAEARGALAAGAAAPVGERMVVLVGAAGDELRALLRTLHAAQPPEPAAGCRGRVRAAVAGERRAIARELHDVVGHALTLIAVHAGVVSVLGARDAARAAQALDVIEQATAAVAAELAGLARVLADLRLEQVVAAARAAGQPVTVAGGALLPVALREPAARIVREALTNARKHAAGAAVRVVVRSVGAGIELTVANGAGGRLAQAPRGAGLGLHGMRERAAALGGTLAAGPDGHGGWSVRAWLPLSAA